MNHKLIALGIIFIGLYVFCVLIVTEGLKVRMMHGTASVTEALQTPGLVGYWKINEGSGSTIKDFSGNNISGIISGATWTSIAQSGGKALQFDGVNDYVSAGNSSILNPTQGISVQAWIYTKAYTTYPRIISKETSVIANPYDLELTSSRNIKFFIGDGKTEIGTPDIDVTLLNTWVHVVGTYDGQNIKIHINGVLKGTTPRVGTISSKTTNVIFGNNPASTRPFNGIIDEVKIWNKALTQAEIQTEYSSSINTEVDNSLNYLMKNNQTYLTDPMILSLWVDSKMFLGAPISDATKQSIINYFNSKQQSDGSWRGSGMSAMFDTSRVLVAYYELNATPSKSLDTFFSNYDTWDEAKNYILHTGSGDARNMYHAIVGWVTYYHTYPSWLNDFFNYVESSDLSWTNNWDFHKRTHILYSYVIARRPFPNLDEIIDATLNEQLPDGHWNGTMYNFYSTHGDVYFTSIQISLLSQILILYPGHRTAAIQASLEKARVWADNSYNTTVIDGKINGYFGKIKTIESGIFSGILSAGQTGLISANIDMTFDGLVPR